MEMQNDNGLTLFRFGNLASFPRLRHGIATRRGGASRPPFDSLNLSLKVGDDPLQVAANRRRVERCFPEMQPVFVRQVHGRTIAVLHGGSLPKGGRLPGEADAVVTRQPGRLLGILVADCQPVMLFDPVRGAVANIHSGWRGSVANILGRAVAVMAGRFGCRPGDIRAGVGPSLGPCCAEFIHFRQEIPESLWSYRVARHHFDFWSLSRDQLLQAGLRSEHIESADLCTRCRSDLFFSYRAAKPTGRMGAFIGLAPPA
jgi:YfiH family protein